MYYESERCALRQILSETCRTPTFCRMKLLKSTAGSAAAHLVHERKLAKEV